MQAYCVKCRAKREMKDPKSITMKMVSQQLKALVLHVAQRCSESVKHNADHSIGYKYGLDIFNRRISSPFLLRKGRSNFHRHLLGCLK